MRASRYHFAQSPARSFSFSGAVVHFRLVSFPLSADGKWIYWWCPSELPLDELCNRLGRLWMRQHRRKSTYAAVVTTETITSVFTYSTQLHVNPGCVCRGWLQTSDAWCLKGKHGWQTRVKEKYNLSFLNNAIKCWCENSVIHEMHVMRFYARVVLSCISERMTDLEVTVVKGYNSLFKFTPVSEN